ncbi:unnamed protein product, partial [marine sediment metagenome]
MEETVLVELCAGSAALSWHLMGGQRPPVSYAGNKQNYAEAISKVLS